MPFPLGGDFTRDVASIFKVIKADRRICIHDNGTDICDKGHKLKFPGTCFNQAIGTFNSTDPTFQPTFPICTVDYETSGFSDGFIFSSGEKEGINILAKLLGEPLSEHDMYQLFSVFSTDYTYLKRDIEEEGGTFIAELSTSVLSFFNIYTAPASLSSFWRLIQLNPGDLPRGPDFFSELYDLDVASYFVLYNRLTFYMLEVIENIIKEQPGASSFINLVDYQSTVSGTQDICVGDDTPPFILYHSPTQSGTVLVPQNQIVDFSLGDAIAGVNLSSVYITLSGTAAGNIPLVAAGSNLVGPSLSITGDQSAYRFTYVRATPWILNERVFVTISGADLPPTVGGNPFFCGASKVNYFIGEIWFRVLDYTDIGATISGVGDTSPPYLSYTIPENGTNNNSVFTPVTIAIADDLTGVNLSTVDIAVDGELIVENGVAKTSEVQIGGNSSTYVFTYTKDTSFSYNSTVVFDIYAEDRSNLGPNVLDTSFAFSFIDDSTLTISNILPPIGTSVVTSSLNIQVDIIDNTFDVDTEQCFFIINGLVVSGTQTPLVSGVRLTYHPPNEYDYGEPIRIIAHGTNANISAPVVKEQLYVLYYGCRLLHFNDGPFRYEEQINVFVSASNTKKLYNFVSQGYFFTTYPQPKKDIGASIFADNPVSNLPASLNPVAPEHRYGETVSVEFYVKDLDGHELGPYVFTYTIEDRPE